MGATVQCRGLRRVFEVGGQQVPVLHGLDLNIAAGELVAIVGA
jgi:ABC-type lipoprotein export system ATPase subunit